MAALTAYTTPATVRAILGVAATEITDAVLSLPIYPMAFEVELAELDKESGFILAQYATVNAIVAPATPTALQLRFYNVMQLLAAFSVARQLLVSADMFAPIRITDGSAMVMRTKDPYKYLRDGVNASYNGYLTRLRAILVEIEPTLAMESAPDRVFMASTGIATDPVTGT